MSEEKEQVRKVVRPSGNKKRKKPSSSSVGNNRNALPQTWTLDGMLPQELMSGDNMDMGTRRLLEMVCTGGNKTAVWLEFIACQILRMNQELNELKAILKQGDSSKLWTDHKPELLNAFKAQWYVNCDVFPSVICMYISPICRTHRLTFFEAGGTVELIALFGSKFCSFFDNAIDSVDAVRNSLAVCVGGCACVCVGVGVGVYICIYMYIYVYIHIFAYIPVYLCINIYVCRRINM
jgi:hypothetical protein